MNPTHTTSQPTAHLSSMVFSDEKRSPHSQLHVNDFDFESSDLYPHRTCHKSRRRRLLIHALLSLLALVSITAISFLNDIQALNIFGSDEGLGKRAISSGSNGNQLVNKKCKFFSIDREFLDR